MLGDSCHRIDDVCMKIQNHLSSKGLSWNSLYIARAQRDLEHSVVGMASSFAYGLECKEACRRVRLLEHAADSTC